MLLGIFCVLTGQYIAYTLEARVDLLEKIAVMITLIESEINYLQRPADEIFISLSGKKELKKLKSISSCSQLMNDGICFKTAWSKALSVKSNVRFLEKDDVNILNSFGETFGITDKEGQIQNCRLHLSLTESKLKEARQKRDSCASLSCGLGALTGIGVFIILL